MRKLGILMAILALMAVMAFTVMLGSPYAPVVAPVMEIEEIWAIEDARTESETPLVTLLASNGVPMAYEKEQNTFYCPIGLENGDEWPQLHLTAPGAKGVSLVFVDDYHYDYCSDAIREGYTYEVMAYTDAQYSYFYIIFTGLTQVSIESDVELGTEDRPIEVSIYKPGASLTSHARTHYRGASTLAFEKHPYKIEFTRTRDGRNKVYCDVPGHGQMNQFILIPMWYDNSLLRDRLSWAMYGEMVSADEPYGARRHEYVELFVNGQYEGVYLLMEPYDHAKEIAKLGTAHMTTDSVYSSAPIYEVYDRPTIQGAFVEGRGFALHYLQENRPAFADMEDYIEICKEEDDVVFAKRMNEQMDMESLLRYHLIMQSFGLGDNVFNNQFIWASREDGRIRYRFVLWDMDMSWGEDDHIEWILEDYDGWMYFPVVDRLLNLDAGARARWAAMWREMRETVMTYENVEQKLMAFSSELNDSGAMMRNAERWGNGNPISDPFEILNYTNIRLKLMDDTVNYIEQTQGPIPMLVYDDPEMESGKIYGFDGRESGGLMK